MVDEYQDTNSIQFEMVRALTSTHDNLCVVGDDDQSIYGFRGADITNILSFEKHYPRAKVIKLEQNYRSTSPILDLANNVIKENKHRRDKKLWSDKQNDHIPLLWSMSDSDHEAQVIVEEIVQYQAKGLPLNEVAILYRSNTQIPPFEDELRLSQVPYTVFGGQKFYEKKEIKDLIAYMQVLMNPHDQLAMRRILNVPHRGIGNVTLKKFVDVSEYQKCSLYNAMKKNPELAGVTEKAVHAFIELIEEYRQVFKQYSLPEAIEKFVEKIDYNHHIEKQYDQISQADLRKNDVLQFIESARRFTRGFGDKATLENYVEQLLLQDVRDKDDMDKDDEDSTKENRVNMMTLHTAKGLEFNMVFLVGMEEELLPHKKCIAEPGGLSEERRLAYVGVTRAREKLIMSYCKERMMYGKKSPRFRSRFINELNKHYTEQDRTTFGHLSEEEAQDYKKSFFANLMDTLE
jgi:superfamily I DNA/RNA helicase